LNSPRNIRRLIIKPIRHKHLIVLVLISCSQDISALKRLREVAENVEDVEDGFVGAGRAGDIYPRLLSASELPDIKIEIEGKWGRKKTYKSSLLQ
jgi:hypothetical protein